MTPATKVVEDDQQKYSFPLISLFNCFFFRFLSFPFSRPLSQVQHENAVGKNECEPMKLIDTRALKPLRSNEVSLVAKISEQLDIASLRVLFCSVSLLRFLCFCSSFFADRDGDGVVFILFFRRVLSCAICFKRNTEKTKREQKNSGYPLAGENFHLLIVDS